MISAIKGLMQGRSEIAEAFKISEKFWSEFFETAPRGDVDSLAKNLSDAQFKYENVLDMNRGLAKELMPYTAFASLYDEGAGFDDNEPLAQELAIAFEQSMCSLEVKFSARRAAALFHLAGD